MDDKQKQNNSLEAFAESFNHNDLLHQVRLNRQLMTKVTERAKALSREIANTKELIQKAMDQLQFPR